MWSHPFPTASFSSGISLLSPHITWEIWSPLIVFSAVPWCSRGICRKKPSALLACQLFANLNPKPLQPLVQHYSWQSCISHTFFLCFTGCVIALLWQYRNTTLWPPRAPITQLHINCSTPKALRLQRKTTLDSIFSHLSEELVVQAAAWLQQWLIVKGRSLQDGNCMFKNQSVFHKHPY